LKACPLFGIPQREQFTTIDLFEGKGMLMVLRNVNRLYQIHQQHQGSLKTMVESGQLVKQLETKTLEVKELRISRVPTIEKVAFSGVASPSEASFRAPADVSSLQNDVEAMQLFKYDPVLERQAKKWIEV